MSQAEIITILLESTKKMTRLEIAEELIRRDKSKHPKWTYNNISAYLAGLHKRDLIAKSVNLHNKKSVLYFLADIDEAKKFLADRNVIK